MFLPSSNANIKTGSMEVMRKISTVYKNQIPRTLVFSISQIYPTLSTDNSSHRANKQMLFLKPLGITARFQSPCMDNTLSLESDCSVLLKSKMKCEMNMEVEGTEQLLIFLKHRLCTSWQLNWMWRTANKALLWQPIEHFEQLFEIYSLIWLKGPAFHQNIL